MADHTVVTSGGDSGAALIIGIVLAVALVIGAIWLFNSGALNGNPAGPTVTVEAPVIQVPAPAAPAPAAN